MSRTEVGAGWVEPSNVDEDVDVDSACTAEDAVLRRIARPFEERRGPSREHESQRAVVLPLPRMRKYTDTAIPPRGIEGAHPYEFGR